jgi:hypothetical protein
MTDYFGGKDLDRLVGCGLPLLAVALLAIGAIVGLIVGYLIWGGT